MTKNHIKPQILSIHVVTSVEDPEVKLLIVLSMVYASCSYASDKHRIAEICDVHYTADDTILEIDIAFAGYTIEECYKACYNMFRYPGMQLRWDYFIDSNNRSEKYMYQVWCDYRGFTQKL